MPQQGHLRRALVQTVNNFICHLTPMWRPVGRPALTWLKQIETDMNATNVQLNLSKDRPEQIIIILENITKDRSNWRRIIRDAMDGTHPKVL